MKSAFAAFALALLSNGLAAQPLEIAKVSLYTGKAAVADQSAGALARGMPLALAEVLHKLSGLRDFADHPGLDAEALQAGLRNARSMAVTFYYLNHEARLPDGSTASELRLVAEFSRPAVNQLVQALQLPLWKPERKPLTTWLVVDDGNRRSIMPIELEYAWDAMAAVAETRGLPLIRPQPDAEGQYGVDEQLLWGGYTEDLAELGATEVLIIAARREGNEWNARMNLEYAGQSWSWRSRDAAIELALAAGMHTAVSNIAVVNSISAADQGSWTVEVTVTGLQNAGDYARCLAYLEGLSVVENVRVLQAGPGRVHFNLGLNALPEHFARAIADGGVLAPGTSDGEYSLLP